MSLEGFEIYPEDFCCKVPADFSLEKLDLMLFEHGLETRISAPKEYTVSDIFAQAWDRKNLVKSCLGLKLKHVNDLITKTGGLVYKNVAGYDLASLYIGSYNALAEIIEVNIRVFKAPKMTLTMHYLKSALPESLYDFTLNYPDSHTMVSFNEDSYKIIFSLSGDEEYLKIREKRILEKFGQAHESKYKEYRKHYPDDLLRMEFYSPTNDFKQVDSFIITSRFLTNSYVIKADDNVLVKTLDDSFFKSKEMEYLKNISKTYGIRLFPVTAENKNREREASFQNKNFEAEYVVRLKNFFDESHRLAPGLLTSFQ